MTHLLLAGALTYGALYSIFVFVAGFRTENALAWHLIIAAAGLSYFSFAIQEVSPGAGRFFVMLSILVGAAAGIALLI